MGFALCQEVNGNKAIITCGSKSFKPAQQQYTTIELECLAIIWAIQKCELYLKGLPNFTVATDYKPLVGTFTKGISELTNPRLQRLREKVVGYKFTVIYVPGKTHNIANAFSRAPIFPGSDDMDIQIDTALAHLVTTSDLALKVIYECIDHDYTQCIMDIREGTTRSHLIKQLKNIKSEISVNLFIILQLGCDPMDRLWLRVETSYLELDELGQ